MKGWRIFWLVWGLTFFVFLNVGQAQGKFPSRSIELVVPMAPGGSSDRIARIFSDELSQVLKVPILVVNRAGGAGIQAATYTIRAKKDGYILLLGSGSSLIITPTMSKEATYDPVKDFIPLGQFVSVPTIIGVKSDSPFQTLNDLIEYARKNPGRLRNGAAGIGAESQFNMEVLCTKNNIKVTTVPFNSGGEALIALLGGHVDISSISLPTMGPQIKAGKLRGLALTFKTRHPEYPNLPTTSELGHPYAKFCTWFGVFAPTGVPQSVANVLVPALEKVFKNPEMIQRAIKAGYMPDYKDPEELRNFVEEELQIVEKVLKDADLSKK